MAKKQGVQQDLSSFMAILIMTIGALVVLLVSNTLVIISNPENTQITSVITSSLYVPAPLGKGDEGGAPFPQGNTRKEPSYIDVHRDRIIIYPGEHVLPVRDLERTGNALENLLQHLEENRDEEYAILLVRPRASMVARQLAKAIRDRGIGLGQELYEEERQVNYDSRRLQPNPG
jgi:hypothetical protein